MCGFATGNSGVQKVNVSLSINDYIQTFPNERDVRERRMRKKMTSGLHLEAHFQDTCILKSSQNYHSTFTTYFKQGDSVKVFP